METNQILAKAKTACELSDQGIENPFVDVNKRVELLKSS